MHGNNTPTKHLNFRCTILCLLIFGCTFFISSCSSNDDSSEKQKENTETTQTENEEENTTTATDTANGLDANVAPSANFNLTTWNISIPIDKDGNNKADTVKEDELNNGYQNSNYFYTGTNGGMVFKCPVAGYKTSENTKYTRTELREMLRAGNTNIETQGITKNNWVFGSAPQTDIDNAGGYDGELYATLAVNHVTTTGDDDQVGRVIIGQIHANNDEPLRIYYRKLPNNTLGSIYIAHEENAAAETYYELIGSRSKSATNPEDGIVLDEKFSYTVKVTGNSMWVTINRDGKDAIEQFVAMTNSGYDVGGQYMYFKAGVYNQNNSGTATDYVQATFYSLKSGHSK
ncbi:polysaccharide lyase family 7 protein [Cellulophaga sp. 20_2_10]|uniref:polysaccharide lyase family 7 protein n=1 Tax=Cellulophaga sp. 20_2_10 TaxID=2942476 RepID=UPI00201A41F5|nr:polysaccharide lyase family 7 protein [Cellulophaga sp. 20_2_10]MCL5244473.1 polysaccharide lyase family 7 protein [Cellulophaga sp. 20_2_10]